jgi:general secretion pathway protein D
MTSHAKAASVFIGETVPYISSTYYGGGYNGGPSSSYQQMSVGIGLNVTPFINPDGLVVMTIDETIDDISGYTTVDGNSVPNTTHRTLSDEIAVRDRETIVLGGFIKSSKTNNKTGMPILKDIPLLGMFFSSTTKSKERDELLVLMRPTVLKTPEMAAAHTAEEKRRLPGIRQAEAEDQAYEDKRAKQAEDALKQKAEKPSGQDAQGFRPMP